jgi:hypothetical protein
MTAPTHSRAAGARPAAEILAPSAPRSATRQALDGLDPEALLRREVMTASPEFGHLSPMLTAARNELATVVVTDAGYWHLEQINGHHRPRHAGAHPARSDRRRRNPCATASPHCDSDGACPSCPLVAMSGSGQRGAGAQQGRNKAVAGSETTPPTPHRPKA